MPMAQANARGPKTQAGGLHFLAFIFASVLGTALLLGVSPARAGTLLQEALKPEIDAFIAQDKAAPPAPCQVLFVGSSSIVKWKEWLAADMAPMPVINRGFGGSHIENINDWFDDIVAPYKPRTIVFYAGDNDLDAGGPPERVIADFDAFMTLKRKSLGSTPVYFISVKPSKLRVTEFPIQARVNEAIKQRAQNSADLHYIDVVDAMMQDGQPKDIFQADGLHMTRAGYEIWAQIVKAALLPTTEADSAKCRRAH